MTLPAGYSVSITRIPLNSAQGVLRLKGRQNHPTILDGGVVLNVVDGYLRSVTVYPEGKRPVKIPASRVQNLTWADFADRLIFQGLTR